MLTADHLPKSERMKGDRVATKPMHWKKSDGTVVDLDTGQQFYCLGAEGDHCLVIVDTKHAFWSSIASIEARSRGCEEPPC